MAPGSESNIVWNTRGLWETVIRQLLTLGLKGCAYFTSLRTSGQGGGVGTVEFHLWATVTGLVLQLWTEYFRAGPMSPSTVYRDVTRILLMTFLILTGIMQKYDLRGLIVCCPVNLLVKDILNPNDSFNLAHSVTGPQFTFIYLMPNHNKSCFRTYSS